MIKGRVFNEATSELSKKLMAQLEETSYIVNEVSLADKGDAVEFDVYAFIGNMEWNVFGVAENGKLELEVVSCSDDELTSTMLVAYRTDEFIATILRGVEKVKAGM